MKFALVILPSRKLAQRFVLIDPDRGRVLVAETLVPAGDEPAQVKFLDMIMLAVTGGLERTEAQYARLFERSGLRLERVIDTGAPISILEASPA